MAPIMFLILSISLIGICIIFALSHIKIEKYFSKHLNGTNNDLNSFMTKIKGNSSKLRR
jgi:hypothetical protein